MSRLNSPELARVSSINNVVENVAFVTLFPFNCAIQSVKIEMDDELTKAEEVKRAEADDTQLDNDAEHKETQQRSHFEKNLYTFSANAGRHLKQELLNSTKPLVSFALI